MTPGFTPLFPPSSTWWVTDLGVFFAVTHYVISFRSGLVCPCDVLNHHSVTLSLFLSLSLWIWFCSSQELVVVTIEGVCEQRWLSWAEVHGGLFVWRSPPPRVTLYLSLSFSLYMNLIFLFFVKGGGRDRACSQWLIKFLRVNEYINYYGNGERSNFK